MKQLVGLEPVQICRRLRARHQKVDRGAGGARPAVWQAGNRQRRPVALDVEAALRMWNQAEAIDQLTRAVAHRLASVNHTWRMASSAAPKSGRASTGRLPTLGLILNAERRGGPMTPRIFNVLLGTW